MYPLFIYYLFHDLFIIHFVDVPLGCAWVTLNKFGGSYYYAELVLDLLIKYIFFPFIISLQLTI